MVMMVAKMQRMIFKSEHITMTERTAGKMQEVSSLGVTPLILRYTKNSNKEPNVMNLLKWH